MHLYYGPGTCSMGIHILLEEAGATYDATPIDVRGNQTKTPEYLAVNPKGKVPALARDDGPLLTEFPTIARYIARTFPDAKLAPSGGEAETEADMAAEYICGTVHPQGFTRIFRPANFAPNEAEHDAVKARGREIAESGFAILSEQLGTKDWIAGDYSYADAALFFIEFWAAKRLNLTLPANIDAHFRRMLDRPATKRMLEKEGLSA